MNNKIKELESLISDAKIFGNMAKIAKLEAQIVAIKNANKEVNNRVVGEMVRQDALIAREVALKNEEAAERAAVLQERRDRDFQLRMKNMRDMEERARKFKIAQAKAKAAKKAKRLLNKELDKMVKSQQRWVNSPSWHLGTTGPERLANILPTIIAELESILETQEDIQFCKFFAHCWDKFASNPYYQYWQMIGERKGWDYSSGTVDLNGALNELFVPKGRVLEAGALRFFKK